MVSLPPAPTTTATALAFLRVQLAAASFGLALLALAGLTRWLWPAEAWFARYDFLLVGALAIQAFLLAAKFETLDEAKVVFGFHLVGTVMEIFKTAVGSWVYPEENFFRIGGVPLFSGFMYSAVGSYLARAWRGYEVRFERYPPFGWTVLLAAAIYVNFFTHHYVWDLRWPLIAATLILFARTRGVATVGPARLTFRPAALFLAVALGLWLAENAATASNVWLYPHQLGAWRPVSLAKIGSWYLLMIVSFVLVSLVHRPDRDTVTAPRSNAFGRAP